MRFYAAYRHVGVRDTVYFYYPEVPEGTALGGTHPNAILHYALPMSRALCEGAEELTGGRRSPA